MEQALQGKAVSSIRLKVARTAAAVLVAGAASATFVETAAAVEMCYGHEVTIKGTSGNDPYLYGTDGKDVTLHDTSGADYFFGGDGYDWLYAADSAPSSVNRDRLFGQYQGASCNTDAYDYRWDCF